VASRRDLLGAVGTVTLTVVTGCAESGEPTSGPTDGAATARTTAAAETVRFVVRLRGPSANHELLTGRDLAATGDVRQFEGGWGFSARLSDTATERLSEQFAESGVTDDPSAFRLQIRVDGETRRELGVRPSFANAVASEGYEGEFVFTFETEATATAARTAAEDG
jgi:hypothetical protein